MMFQNVAKMMHSRIIVILMPLYFCLAIIIPMIDKAMPEQMCKLKMIGHFNYNLPLCPSDSAYAFS